MGKRIDLTGQTFGELTVIEFAGRMGGEAGWLCQCSCGCRTKVRGQSLRNGDTRSCGHLRSEKARARIEVDDRFRGGKKRKSKGYAADHLFGRDRNVQGGTVEDLEDLIR